MTPIERRGMWLYLILATVIVIHRLLAAVYSIGDHWIQVVSPLTTAGAVAVLWQGEVWVRWLVGAVCLALGGMGVCNGLDMYLMMAELPPSPQADAVMRFVGYPSLARAATGGAYIVAGLLFLTSRSMQAFFRHQRDRSV